MRERGLKQILVEAFIGYNRRSYAGAWIETRYDGHSVPYPRSLPMRERGLKQVGDGHPVHGGESLPMRERGLKHQSCRSSPCMGSRSLCGSVD